MKSRTKLWDETHYKEEVEKLPLRIQKDIHAFYKPEIREIESAFIYGRIGSGKTIQAVGMMLDELRTKFIRRQYMTAKFITIPELLLEFKNSYSNKDKEGSQTEQDLVNYYGCVRLLVLDDFGVERTTDWAFQLLYIIINRRYENMLKTIFTSNIDLNALAKKLGDDRIPSRIQQMCKVIESKNINYREQKSD